MTRREGKIIWSGRVLDGFCTMHLFSSQWQSQVKWLQAYHIYYKLVISTAQVSMLLTMSRRNRKTSRMFLIVTLDTTFEKATRGKTWSHRQRINLCLRMAWLYISSGVCKHCELQSTEDGLEVGITMNYTVLVVRYRCQKMTRVASSKEGGENKC